jgi:hypothetical protein
MMATRLPHAQKAALVTGVWRLRQACPRGAEADYRVIASAPLGKAARQGGASARDLSLIHI